MKRAGIHNYWNVVNMHGKRGSAMRSMYSTIAVWNNILVYNIKRANSTDTEALIMCKFYKLIYRYIHVSVYYGPACRLYKVNAK